MKEVGTRFLTQSKLDVETRKFNQKIIWIQKLKYIKHKVHKGLPI